MPANFVLLPDGTDCSDGAFCDGEERCAQGRCAPGPFPCLTPCDESGDRCLARCPASPGPCRTASQAALVLADRGDDSRRRLQWKWKGGPADRAHFGDPTQTTGYALCVYAGTTETLVIQLPVTAPAAWQPTGSGYRYRDGTFTLKLDARSDRTARIAMRGGGLVPSPPLPLAMPAVAQLFASDTAACWASPFAPDAVRHNDDRRFRAVNPR